MTATADLEPPVTTPVIELTLPANAAAIAWLNCFSASSKNDARPKLYRTMAIEIFRTLSHRGVQFVGCDGHVLFRTFVAEREDDANTKHEDRLDLSPFPEGEPLHKLVVYDSEGFGLAFFRTLLTVTNSEENALQTLTLSTSLIDKEEEPSLGMGLCAGRITLVACGQRIDLKLYDGHYPNWRALDLGIDSFERVDELRVGPRLLSLVGKLKAINSVDFAFRGQEKAIDFKANGILTNVWGLIMPMRKEEKKADDAEEGAED